MVVLLTHETHWASWKESFWWRGWKVGRVTEFMWKRGLVMGSKIAKVVPYKGEPPSTPFARGEEPSACHHSTCHLFHSSFFTTFVLKPDLCEKRKNEKYKKIFFLPSISKEK